MSSNELTDALCALPCFKKVPPDAVAELATTCAIKTFDTRDVVLSQGEGTGIAYLVIKGMLEVSVQTRQTQHHIATITPGEIAGESALFIRGVSRNATVLAHKPSVCLELKPEDLRRLTGNAALVALEFALIVSLSRRIRKTNLAIQSAWKQTHADDYADEALDVDEGPKTFAGRLKAMFTGRGGSR